MMRVFQFPNRFVLDHESYPTNSWISSRSGTLLYPPRMITKRWIVLAHAARSLQERSAMCSSKKSFSEKRGAPSGYTQTLR